MSQNEQHAEYDGFRLEDVDVTETTELTEDDLDQVAGGDWAPTPPPPTSGTGGG